MLNLVASPSALSGVTTLTARPLICAATTCQYDSMRASGRMNVCSARASSSSDARSSARITANTLPTRAIAALSSSQPSRCSVQYSAAPPTASIARLNQWLPRCRSGAGSAIAAAYPAGFRGWPAIELSLRKCAVDRALDRTARERGLERAHLGEALAGHSLRERAIHRGGVDVAVLRDGGGTVCLGALADRREVEVRASDDMAEIELCDGGGHAPRPIKPDASGAAMVGRRIVVALSPAVATVEGRCPVQRWRLGLPARR